MKMNEWKKTKPEAEAVLSDQHALDLIAWLRANKMPPAWLELENDAVAWTAEHKGRKLFIVLDDKGMLSLMVQGVLTKKHQTLIAKRNLQDIVLANLCYCSRKDGEECSGCGLPPDVAGVDSVLFGREVKHFCCGQMLNFQNPDGEAIECIKTLLSL